MYLRAHHFCGAISHLRNRLVSESELPKANPVGPSATGWLWITGISRGIMPDGRFALRQVPAGPHLQVDMCYTVQSCQAYHAAASFLMFGGSAVCRLVDLAAKQGRADTPGTVAKHIPPLRVRLNISHTCFSVYWSLASCVFVESTHNGCRAISCFDRGPGNDDESTRSCDLTRLHPESCIWSFRI